MTELKIRVLIICPVSLKQNWKRELVKWLIKPIPVFIADSKMCPDMLGVTIINYDVLHKHEEVLHNVEYDVLICDEAHLLKSGQKTRRGKMIMGVRATAKEKRQGMADIPGIQAKKKIFMTGTPICNKPKELFPLINFLDPIAWADEFKFKLRYCGGTRSSGYWNFDGASHLDELQEKLRTSIMVRRLKKDVLKDLPPKLRRIVEFAPTGEMLTRIKAERAMFDSDEDYKKEAERLYASPQLFGARSTVRREDAIAKAQMPEIINYLDNAVVESEKVIIFIWHPIAGRILKEHFKDKMELIVGDTPISTRQAHVDRFQTDPTLKIICGGILPMGVGLTLTASSRVIFMELDDVPGRIVQAEDRAHRHGQLDNVLVEHLIISGTLDAVMCRNCVDKQNVIDAALDTTGRAGKPKQATIPLI